MGPRQQVSGSRKKHRSEKDHDLMNVHGTSEGKGRQGVCWEVGSLLDLERFFF